MLLDDAIKLREAKKLEEKPIIIEPTVVAGIMTTKEGLKDVNVSLGSDGLKIEEAQNKTITRKPRKTKAKGR